MSHRKLFVCDGCKEEAEQTYHDRDRDLPFNWTNFDYFGRVIQFCGNCSHKMTSSANRIIRGVWE